MELSTRGQVKSAVELLKALVSERLGKDLRGGTMFVFSNRRHNRIELLYWDGTRKRSAEASPPSRKLP